MKVSWTILNLANPVKSIIDQQVHLFIFNSKLIREITITDRKVETKRQSHFWPCLTLCLSAPEKPYYEDVCLLLS